VIAAIASLGYASHEQVLDYPDPFSPALAELPAGRECAEEHELFLRASRAMLAGRSAEAGDLYAEVVARNPRHPMALIGLARALMHRGEWSRAAELLQRRLTIPPERVAIHRDLARCYDELGDTEARDRHAIRALERLIEIHTLHGERDEAEEYRRLLEQALAR
jgi:predicted Zn-dependent protease